MAIWLFSFTTGYASLALTFIMLAGALLIRHRSKPPGDRG
jgi:hypothetical protein